jgi:cysteine protease ATG4
MWQTPRGVVWSISYRTLYSVRCPTFTKISIDLNRALSNGRQSSKLRVYITGDGSDVYEDTFMGIAKPAGDTFQPTLILVGTRLGLDKITPVYWEALKASLQMPQSIGIAG